MGDALLDLNREYAMEHLADPGAILVADPTGFAKKGTKSVGVQRQYSGTLGRIDNCQIATFLGYVTPGRDRVLLDRRLYLPKESWMADPARCAAAGVPPDLTFKTRPAQVREMIEAARAAGVGFAWFTADEEFGQNPPYATTSKRAASPMSWPCPRPPDSSTPPGRRSTSTHSPGGYAAMRGNAAPAGSARKDPGSMTGHCSTPPTPTTST